MLVRLVFYVQALLRGRLDYVHQRLELSWMRAGRPSERNVVSSSGRYSEASLTAYWFMWCYQGTCTCRVAGKTYSCNSDTIVLFQPGHSFQSQTDPLEPTGGYLFGFNIEKANSEWPLPQKWPIARRVPANDLIRPLFRYVIANGPDETSGGEVPLAIVAAIELMLSEFILGPTQLGELSPQSYPQPVRRLLEWISSFTQTSVAEKVSLDEIAQACGVCKSHISSLCKKHLGYGPVDLVYVYRLTRSLQGLRVGQKIESMAEKFGFASAGHYTRRFERLFGKSPRQMRAAMAKGYKPRLPDLPFM